MCRPLKGHFRVSFNSRIFFLALTLFGWHEFQTFVCKNIKDFSCKGQFNILLQQKHFSLHTTFYFCAKSFV